MNKKLQKLVFISSVFFTPIVLSDEQIQDDLVVVGSICSGLDCVNGESFGFDTIRLKENNLRIKFMDTSSSSSFPSIDWQITVNDSINGGANWFGVEDLDAGTRPFSILAGAPTNSVYVSSTGRVGFGTTTPMMDLSVKRNNTPTLRLTQDEGAGFSEQEWDVGGNETNFFIRDVTNGSLLPFRIKPNAPNNSIYVAANGDIGFETATPDGLLDIASPWDANNHAVLVDPKGYFGINIDNGLQPKGLFDVQTTGGVSRFTVQNDGNVGIGTATPNGRFDVRDLDNTKSYFNIDTAGKVILNGVLNVNGSSTVKAADTALVTDNIFDVQSSDSISMLAVKKDGSVIINNNDATTPPLLFDVQKAGTSQFKIDSGGTVTVLTDICLENGKCLSGNIATPTPTPTPTTPTLLSENWMVKQVGQELQFVYTAPDSLPDPTPDPDPASQTIFTLKSFGAIEAYRAVCGTGHKNDKTIKDASCMLKDTNRIDMYSSKALKDIDQVVNSEEVLEKLSRLEVSRWRYKSDDDDSIVHMGVMSEDFHAAFSLNGDTTDRIAIVDALGVSMASIQALHNKLKEKDTQIEKIHSELDMLKSELKEIKLLLKK